LSLFNDIMDLSRHLIGFTKFDLLIDWFNNLVNSSDLIDLTGLIDLTNLI